MLSLFKAIKKEFTDPAGSLFGQADGGIYRDRRPERKSGHPAIVYPYVTVQIESAPKRMSFGSGNSTSDVAVRFIVTASGTSADADAGTLAELIERTLRDRILTLDSGQMINCISMHEPYSLPLQRGLGSNEGDVWMWLATLVFSVRN
jgi:hypothetical protein